MTALFKYLDNIPQIPEVLVQEIRNTPAENKKGYFPFDTNKYSIYYVQNKQLKDYLKEIFPGNFQYLVQVIRENIDPHKDIGRYYCFNYIIDTGGSNVETRHFDDNMNLIKTSVAEERRWHFLNTDVYHGVYNIEYPRIALTVTNEPKRPTPGQVPRFDRGAR